MRRGLFARLAADNIRRNKSTYIPYILTCVFCIAATYMMSFVKDSPNLDAAMRDNGAYIQTVLAMGIGIILIFSVIFLLYNNSFLMKRRQKELALYNVLGMEKRHIGRFMALETVFTSVISFALGIIVGILMSKLALLLLFRLLHVPATLGFYISISGILNCGWSFGLIFLLTLFKNLRRVYMARPVELLHGDHEGEREPKAKWLIALIGMICLVWGYYLAVTTESPIDALEVFFLAIVLVMAGTYLLFTAGSIVILKLMKMKKSFYYKIQNFTAVSGLLYRMKQNAVGLASICILSTGVLLVISTTMCLNMGINDTVTNRYPYDADYSVTGSFSQEEGQDLIKIFQESLEKNQIPVTEQICQVSARMTVLNKEDELQFATSSEAYSGGAYQTIRLVTDNEYKRITGESAGISDGEILAYRETEEKNSETLIIDGKVYKVKQWMHTWPLLQDKDMVVKNTDIIVTDNDFSQLWKKWGELNGRELQIQTFEMGFNVDGNAAQQIKCGNLVKNDLIAYMEQLGRSDTLSVTGGVREEEKQSYYELNGGLLFLGMFLGALFLTGAAMIIYYKQLSEGYEDKGRFEIMQKVGMSHKEVRSTIRRQILMVFFLPLIMAVIHMCAAFPLVRRIMLMFGMNNTALFVWCTAGTVLVFALIYGLVYLATARTYYRIVES